MSGEERTPPSGRVTNVPFTACFKRRSTNFKIWKMVKNFQNEETWTRKGFLQCFPTFPTQLPFYDLALGR